jgi:polyisoprenoid-binding protein YceI
MMTVRGHFADVQVTGTIDPDHPEATALEVTIQTASIRTHHEQRDNDLRSSNFLEVDKYPTITFKSANVAQRGENRYTMTGDLTIKGVTQSVTLNMVKYGEFNDPRMGHRIGYSGEGQINRKDFGMSFSPMLDGKFVVSNEVQILIEGELVERPQEPTEATANA